MSKRVDFANDLATVRSRADDEVASLLKLVNEKATNKETESAAPISPPQPIKDAVPNDSFPDEPSIAPPPPRPNRSQPRARRKPTPLEERVKKNVNFRIPVETNELLTEVAYRQKLKKAIPDNRQDIVDVALQEFFRRYGYLKSSGEAGTSEPDAE